jgi:hypothetical protein
MKTNELNSIIDESRALPGSMADRQFFGVGLRHYGFRAQILGRTIDKTMGQVNKDLKHWHHSHGQALWGRNLANQQQALNIRESVLL